MKSKLISAILILVIVVCVVTFTQQLNVYSSGGSQTSSALSAAESILTRVGIFFGWIEPKEEVVEYKFE